MCVGTTLPCNLNYHEKIIKYIVNKYEKHFTEGCRGGSAKNHRNYVDVRMAVCRKVVCDILRLFSEITGKHEKKM